MVKFLSVFTLFVVLPMSALAHANDTEDAYQYRSGGFHIIKTWFMPIGATVKGKIPFDQASVQQSADAIAALAPLMSKGFEHDQIAVGSEALPEIWQDKEAFDETMSAFVKAAQALAVSAQSAKGTEDIKADFIAVAKTCKGCHKKFRK